MTQARLDALTERIKRLAEAAAEARAQTAPFCEIRIEDLRGEGVARLIYHPDGKRGQRQELEGLTVARALEWASTRQLPAFIDLIFCPLWAYAFYRKCGLYTSEQLELFRQRDIEKFPDVAEIAALDDAEAIIDRLAEIPQNFWIYPHGASGSRKGGDT